MKSSQRSDKPILLNKSIVWHELSEIGERLNGYPAHRVFGGCDDCREYGRPKKIYVAEVFTVR